MKGVKGSKDGGNIEKASLENFKKLIEYYKVIHRCFFKINEFEV